VEVLSRYPDRFRRRILTPSEDRYCRGKPERIAGRWAAKEAVLKCLGTGWQKGLCWTDMEVRNDKNGLPHVQLTGAARERAQFLHITNVLLSISHCRAYATAHAVAVAGLPRPSYVDEEQG
jgi:holo-[acyl-carrier protein] synthase